MLGLFFVSYGEMVGHVGNIVVAVLAIVVPYFFLSRSTQGTHGKRIRRDILIGFVLNCVATALALGLVYGIATELDATGNSMVW